MTLSPQTLRAQAPGPTTHRTTPALALLGLSALLLAQLSACGNAADSPTSSSTSTAPQSSTVGNAIDDAVVTTRVKSALMADPRISSYDFKVDTRNGEVLLSGFVENQEQVDLASAIVRAVDGVKSIQYNVTVKKGQASVGNKVDDGLTTARIKAALLADPTIHSMDIGVVTRVGEVQLSGFVNTRQEMDRAVQTASAIEGVRHVGNEMQLKK